MFAIFDFLKKIVTLGIIVLVVLMYGFKACTPTKEVRNNVTEMEKIYNLTKQTPSGSLCMCPLCHETFQKGNINFCCADHEKEYFAIINAWDYLESAQNITKNIKLSDFHYDN